MTLSQQLKTKTWLYYSDLELRLDSVTMTENYDLTLPQWLGIKTWLCHNDCKLRLGSVTVTWYWDLTLSQWLGIKSLQDLYYLLKLMWDSRFGLYAVERFQFFMEHTNKLNNKQPLLNITLHLGRCHVKVNIRYAIT